MKNIVQVVLLLVTVLFCGGRASAQNEEPVTGVATMFKSTMTCPSVQISSQTPTPMLNTLVRYRGISIQNRDTTANIFCAPSVSVATQTGTTFNAGTGWEIPAGSTPQDRGFTLYPGEQIYCLNDSATKTSFVTTCVGR